jgi:hypothetical protein
VKPVGVFTLAYGDPQNLVWAGMMINSFKKFHKDIPVHVFTDEDVNKISDPRKSVRMYAHFGKQMAEEYETVIQLDSDSIVTGDLNHILDDKTFDLGGVLNNNLIDPLLMIHDIPPQVYLNAGLIVARDKRFWRWWDELNYRVYFNSYRFGEQDTFNMIFHYGDYRTKIFDIDYKGNWHGLVHKGQWHKFILKDKQIILPKTEGVCNEDKIIRVIHWAGGKTNKMNFHTYFSEDVVKRLQELISD